MLKSEPLPHCLFLETSTPSDYILDDFTVLYLPVQDLCFFLNEEHERTCRATKGKIYIICKQIFPLYNGNNPNTGSFMGVGNLLGTWWYWWRRILKDVFSSSCVIKTCLYILCVLLPEGEGFGFCTTHLCHFSDASGGMSGPVLRCFFRDSTCLCSVASPELMQLQQRS